MHARAMGSGEERSGDQIAAGDDLPSDFNGDQATTGLFTGQAGGAAPSAGLLTPPTYSTDQRDIAVEIQRPALRAIDGAGD